MFVCALFFFSDQRLRFQGSCGWAGSKKGARPMDKGAGVKERESGALVLDYSSHHSSPRGMDGLEGCQGMRPNCSNFGRPGTDGREL